jgi:site-specific recombinase XerD
VVYTIETDEQIEQALARHTAAGRLSESDRNLIDEYVLELSSASKIGGQRKYTIINELVLFRRFAGCDYKDLTTPGALKAIQALKTGNSSKGKPFSPKTLQTVIVVVRAFLLWLVENNYATLNSEKIKKIAPPRPPKTTHRPEDLLTREDIKKLIDAAYTSRDRAFIATLYESGMRIIELAHIRWKDLAFEPPYGVRVYIPDTKNNQTRYVRLLMAASYLATWRNDSKMTGPDDMVFVSRQDTPLTYQNALVITKTLGERAGFEKRISPHLFRHSRITHLIQNNTQESIIKKMMWNNLDTKMFGVYVSLSDDDIDKELADKAGIRLKHVKPDISLEPIQCQGCGELNGPTHQFCSQCGKPLTPEARANVEEVIAYAQAQPEYAHVQEMLQRMVQEMTRKNQ